MNSFCCQCAPRTYSLRVSFPNFWGTSLLPELVGCESRSRTHGMRVPILNLWAPSHLLELVDCESLFRTCDRSKRERCAYLTHVTLPWNKRIFRKQTMHIQT
ncbi:hypothetical protein Tcan_00521, partial [Toxocara canis]